MSRLFYKKLDIYIQSRFQRNKFRCYNLKTFLTELNACQKKTLNNIKNVVQRKRAVGSNQIVGLDFSPVH